RLFHLDASARTIEPVPGSRVELVVGVRELDDGRALIATRKGIFIAAPSFDDANLTPDDVSEIRRIRPGQGPTETKWTLRRCAQVADKLGLRILVSRSDAGGHDEKPLSRPMIPVETKDGLAKLTSTISFPTKGKWKLQAVAAATGSDIPVGAPVFVQVDESLLDPLERQWKWLSAVAGFIYVASFGVLFVFAHTNERAFRILSDPVWSKIGVWPFFLLRQVPAAQLWVLEPCFQAIRKTIPGDRPFLDVPVQGPNESRAEATTLLTKLQSDPRLWLQGGAGMGKSAVFAAWERDYYAAPTLSSAVHKHGFVLIMLRVRQFAMLPVS